LASNNIIDFSKYKKPVATKPKLSDGIDGLWPMTYETDYTSFTNFNKNEYEVDYTFASNVDQWAELHSNPPVDAVDETFVTVDKSVYEEKLQTLIDEGIIKSGSVTINEFGIPTIYVTPNMDYNVTLTAKPEANNT
jgi:hypothetical protein